MNFRNNIPVKISPDRIKDSIIQLFFESDLPIVPSIGYFHSFLSSRGYQYVDQNFEIDNSDKKEIKIFDHLFINSEKGIKSQVQPNFILFNCLEKYNGWTNFSKEIIECVESLMEGKIFTKINRIGIRYISEFPDNNIFDKVKLKYECDMFSDKEDIIKINFERQFEDKKILLNLKQNKVQSATIDVNIIKENLSIDSVPLFVTILEQIHILEKRTFFSLLTDEYLESLNPIY